MSFNDTEIRPLPLTLKSCREQVTRFLESFGLRPDSLEYYAGVFINDEMAAGGGFDGNVIKCIAASEEYRGEGLIGTLMTHLREQLDLLSRRHVFLFTKPENEGIFTSLSFYTVGRAKKAVLLDSDRSGVRRYCEKAKVFDGEAAAIVMNCNPFTLGHLELVKRASEENERLYVFVVEEDKSFFPFADRLEMAKAACAGMSNVRVLAGGPYMISSATFPSYFIKDLSDVSRTYAELDANIFAERIAPALNITARYVGSEPTDELTSLYNATLLDTLPKKGIDVRVIERRCSDGVPISASRVRELIKAGRLEDCSSLLPESSIEHIRAMEVCR